MSATGVVPVAEEEAPGRADRRRPAGRAGVAALGVPVVAVLAAGWQRRWMSDDGFINLRVVEQVWAGHGPVFNAGERVEAHTSTLWTAVLVVGTRVLGFLDAAWVAVLLGLALTAAGVLLLQLGARALLDRGAGGVWVPVGVLVPVALSATWDYATSGLENGLAWAWLGGAWLLTARVWRGGGGPVVAAVVVGLAPLVRPDLAVMGAALGLVLLLAPAGDATGGRSPLGRPALRRAVRLIAAGAAVPVVYQAFRMAYYGALVPNTALAKEASLPWWGQGWRYAADVLGTYWLWLALPVLAVAAAPTVRTTLRSRRDLLAVLALPAAALVHALWVIRVGGDFMHARLLLPSLAAAVAPVAALPVRRTALPRSAVAVLAVLAWAVPVALLARTPGQWVDDRIADERAVYTAAAGTDHPVTLDDYDTLEWVGLGRAAAARADAGDPRFWVVDHTADRGWTVAVDVPAPAMSVWIPNVGMFGLAAGPDVRVLDPYGLGDPLASRVVMLERRRPGHDKWLPPAWAAARSVEPGALLPVDPALAADASAARAALACGPFDNVIARASAPLTLSRLAANLVGAVTDHGVRLPPDPTEAEGAFC